MKKKAGSLNKNKTLKFNCTKSMFIVFLFVFTFFLSFIFVFSNCNDIYAAGYNFYTPSSPSGPAAGKINVSYEYVVYTTDIDSWWIFDWGDGRYSNWIKVGGSDTYISQTHSWDSYGIYEVRVKYRSIYMLESAWSPPLTVTIAIPVDLDGDGYNNGLEEAYGKNPENPNEYPLDTDSDGTPDDDSPDGSYTGDLDDDNDGLSDIIEGSIGSNTKDSSDVTCIVIGESFYYLVDIDGDSDILYNLQTESQTETKIEDGKICFDITGDGSWDYTYHAGVIARYKAPFPWLYVIVAVIITVVIVVFLLFKTGVLYLYEEEYVVEK